MSKKKTDPTNQAPEKAGPKKQRFLTWDRIPSDEAEGKNEAIDWQRRSDSGSGPLRWVERLALAVKEPLARTIGSAQLNPLYHSDTIAFFLLIVVALTGVYVWLFYEYGFDVSYVSLENVDRFFISRAARAVHRYASGGLVIFSLIHAIRMFFMDRFRGPRWLGWVAGKVTFAILWITSITGYVMIWDEVAQIIVQTSLNFLKVIPFWAAGFYLYFLTEEASDNGYLLMLILLVLHLGLPAIAGVFYWYHIKRLRRPKFFPATYWMVAMGALLAIIGLIFPSGLPPRADFSRLPEVIDLDAFFLFYIPFSMQGMAASWWIWGILIVVTIALTVIPWIWPGKKVRPVNIEPSRCTGCENCAEDCPYKAITMIPRDDDTPFKLLAQVDPKLCVSCGVCVGSCDTLAISLCDRTPEMLWHDIESRLKTRRANGEEKTKFIFTCERHATHGGGDYIKSQPPGVEIVPVTCVAMLNPALIGRTLKEGADEVAIVGCPPGDCTNREGNVWVEERLNRERAPKLKPSLADAPIQTRWLSPDQFAQSLPAVEAPSAETVRETSLKAPQTFEEIKERFGWRNLVLAMIILAVGLLLQVALTYVPYNPYPDTQAMIDVVVKPAAQPVAAQSAGQLVLEVDGQTLLDVDGSGSVYEQIPVSAGEHVVRLTRGSETLFDEAVTLGQKEALQLAFDGNK